MGSFYSKEELSILGLKSVGENVLISKKASIYGADRITIGNNVRIDDFCILSGKIILGSYIHISAYSAIFASEYGVEMDDFSGISSRVTVYAVSDDYGGQGLTNPMIPDKYRKVNGGKVVIGKHVIIGATSVVLPGVTLAEGSSFGSCSLITKNSEPWSLNVGIPAKKLKDRDKENMKKLEQAFINELNLSLGGGYALIDKNAYVQDRRRAA